MRSSSRPRPDPAKGCLRLGSSKPKHEAIYRDLQARIATGEFAPGSRLPTQVELAHAYGVTVMTLRQALARLAAAG
ncbi:MAG: hypothetical protein C4321_01965, partial [Chloroflexota bacterium]